MRRLILPGAALVLTLLVFYKLAFTDLILARGDTFAYFYPYWAARDAALLAGRLPLWTPDIFMGAPLLSNPQVGVLYPPNWLTVTLPPPEAARLSVLLHIAWATLGAGLLARHTLNLGIVPSIIAGAVFGLGGGIGSHVEQLNQLHGLAWLPWAMLAYHHALRRPFPGVALLAGVLAMQLLSGHTQTVFITGVAVGVYGLVSAVSEPDTRRIPRLLRRLFAAVLTLGGASLAAVVLALPQLLPTLEITGLSNRGEGLNPQQATAFSWNPLLAARGLLPSYDAQIFSEYVVYVGVIGLALAVVGATAKGRGRWVWIVIAGVGVFLAFGRFNPVYMTLATLPGFNLFRVPARWLALLALGAAMLAGVGVETVIRSRRGEGQISRWVPPLAVIVVALTAAATLIAGRAADEVDGAAVPTLVTWAAWAVALALFVAVIGLRRVVPARSYPVLVLVLVVGELFAASLTMPYNDLVDPMAYYDRRFTAYQLEVYDDENESGRLLSITNLLFDPGDKPGLAARYERLGMTERAQRYGFTATKMQEAAAPNLPLIWGIPTVDGYEGGVLPTMWYTQFTSLFLPEGLLRTTDGRLREVLAQAACRGACIPDPRWLDLMHVRYLITDKTFDVWHEDVAYDTTFTLATREDEFVPLVALPDFTADALHLLVAEGEPPVITVDGVDITAEDTEPVTGGTAGMTLAHYPFAEPLTPQTITVTGDAVLRGATLVDTRTGDFVQLAFQPWTRALSSDIKLYENRDVLPRAFVVYDAAFVPDTWHGTESSLVYMREPTFNPRQQVYIAGEAAPLPASGEPPGFTPAEIIDNAPERVEVRVNAEQEGYLVLTDAFYPGWQAALDGMPVTVQRANAMFRAVRVPPGEHTVTFTYQPDWLTWVFPVGGAAWLVLLGVVGVSLWTRRAAPAAPTPDRQIES